MAGQFNILSLDGGGMKGVYSAAVLASIEEDFGIDVMDHVDLIAGTSTGGILALGLANGLSPAHLLEIYCSNADTIFPRRAIRPGLFRRRYSSAGLRNVLNETLGDRTFGESTHRLVIPSYNIDDGDVYVFRTAHTERLRRDWKEACVDVALATSAAPTYFQAHTLRDVRLVDGGLWANNPSMVALAEAVNSCGQALENVHMLSLGTGTEQRARSRRITAAGLIRWARPLVESLMAGQERAATNQCFLMLGDERFTRINPVVPAGLARLDRLHPPDLISRARADSRHVGPQLEAFLTHTAPPFEPIYPCKEQNTHAT